MIICVNDNSKVKFECEIKMEILNRSSHNQNHDNF